MSDDQPKNVRDMNDRIGIGLIVTVIVIIVLAIFVIQNSDRIEVEFLLFGVSMPLWLMAAFFLVLGAVLGWVWRWVRGRRSSR